MKFLIGQAPPLSPPPNLPPSGLEQATMISLLFAACSGTVAALGVIANKLWGWFESKEKSETDQSNRLLDTMLKEREALLEINRQGFIDVTQGLTRLQDTANKAAGTIHDDTQRVMGGQTAIYRSIAESLAEIKAQNRALHERLDVLFDKENKRHHESSH